MDATAKNDQTPSLGHRDPSSMTHTPTRPHWIQPSHPDILEVVKSAEAFQSSAVSRISLPPGHIFGPITTATPVAPKTYSSVQVSRSASIELNSDLAFINHSCDPSLVFDMRKFEVRVVDDRALEVGDALTFFYPSTEWDMTQPFECRCGTPKGKCKGWIDGAAAMRREELENYWLNDHIADLLADKAATSQENGNCLRAERDHGRESRD